MSISLLRDRFRGAMVGAVLGDCLGAPLEFITNGSLPMSYVSQQFNLYAKNHHNKYDYTDDTAMARQIALSVIQSKGKVDTIDLAKRFVDEFYAEPNRGYGGGVVSVFQKLHRKIYPGARDSRSPKRCRRASRSRSSSPEERERAKAEPTTDFDPFLPAKEQFDGSGSYGNGASMRVHPMALFGYKMDADQLAEEVRKTATITHANESGIQGAILQAYAVQLSLQSVSEDNFPTSAFLTSLENVVGKWDESKCDKPESTYTHSMELMKAALENEKLSPAHKLGNDVSAQQSVPSAIFSFLRAQKPVQEIKDEDDGIEFKRCLMVAYSFGGDADTIGSMAGAIAGARVGLSGIPQSFQDQCEGVQDAIDQADKLYDIVFPEEKPKAKL